MILKIVMIRFSKSTIHYIGWSCVCWIFINNTRKYWMNSYEMIWIDLPSLESIQLGKESFTIGEEYNLHNPDSLAKLEIGDDCFGSVKTFKMNGLNRLKSIKIGKNSFIQNKNSVGNDSSKSFHILNCESLESIEIGEYSFSDYAGEFELKNLPQLQSIQFERYNFYHSSFVIRGIELILTIWMIRSSKSTIHYIR